MDKWEVEFKNSDLERIYKSYLFRQEKQITFYLSSVMISEQVNLSQLSLNSVVRASNEFDESATSTKSSSEVIESIKNGEYKHLSRSFAIFGMVTAFCDFFDEIKDFLDVPIPEIKKPIELDIPLEGIIKIKPASLTGLTHEYSHLHLAINLSPIPFLPDCRYSRLFLNSKCLSQALSSSF